MLSNIFRNPLASSPPHRALFKAIIMTWEIISSHYSFKNHMKPTIQRRMKPCQLNLMKLDLICLAQIKIMMISQLELTHQINKGGIQSNKNVKAPKKHRFIIIFLLLLCFAILLSSCFVTAKKKRQKNRLNFVIVCKFYLAILSTLLTLFFLVSL